MVWVTGSKASFHSWSDCREGWSGIWHIQIKNSVSLNIGRKLSHFKDDNSCKESTCTRTHTHTLNVTWHDWLWLSLISIVWYNLLIVKCKAFAYTRSAVLFKWRHLVSVTIPLWHKGAAWCRATGLMSLKFDEKHSTYVEDVALRVTCPAESKPLFKSYMHWI